MLCGPLLAQSFQQTLRDIVSSWRGDTSRIVLLKIGEGSHSELFIRMHLIVFLLSAQRLPIRRCSTAPQSSCSSICCERAWNCWTWKKYFVHRLKCTRNTTGPTAPTCRGSIIFRVYYIFMWNLTVCARMCCGVPYMFVYIVLKVYLVCDVDGISENMESESAKVEVLNCHFSSQLI